MDDMAEVQQWLPYRSPKRWAIVPHDDFGALLTNHKGDVRLSYECTHVRSTRRVQNDTTQFRVANRVLRMVAHLIERELYRRSKSGVCDYRPDWRTRSSHDAQNESRRQAGPSASSHSGLQDTTPWRKPRAGRRPSALTATPHAVGILATAPEAEDGRRTA
jgi:hypothetical protein